MYSFGSVPIFQLLASLLPNRTRRGQPPLGPAQQPFRFSVSQVFSQVVHDVGIVVEGLMIQGYAM